MTRTGFSLVLGGGGFPAHAYLGGVIAALADVAGLDPRRSRMTVGTSAGALQAALVAVGTTPDAHRELALSLSSGANERPFVKTWSSWPELGSRLFGTSVDVGSLAHRRMQYGPQAGPRTRSGLVKTREPERYFGLIPQHWPTQALAVVAYDLNRRRRRVLTSSTSAGLDLRQAVEASMTLPALMEPVRAGRERLVDGGVASATNLDVAARSSARLVIAVAPLGFDPREPPCATHQAAYRGPNRVLSRQSAALRAAGQDLILIRPGATELDVMGINFLRAKSPALITQLAYEQATRILGTERSQRLIGEIEEEK